MTPKLKALGLAFVAVLALGALSATAASAAEFHSEAAHTILDGSQPVGEDDVWTFNAGTVKCTSATYSGTQSSATTASLSVKPTYSGCTAFGFVNTPVHWECVLFFNGSRLVWWFCIIEVTAFNCTVKVAPQELPNGVTYDNAGSGTSRDITATFNLSGIKYTQESKAFPGCTNGTFTNGTYKGSATITGTNTTGSAVGIWSS